MTNFSKVNKPKCIFFDVDGVLTDGSKLYSSDKGSPVIGKRFNDIDFTAFKILKCLDIDFYWISGDETVNKNLAENRSIKFIYTRTNNIPTKKSAFIEKVCNSRGYHADDIWFVGDDFFDTSAIDFAGFSLCPENASVGIKNKVSYVIPRKSGEYIACWIVDFIIDKFKLKYPSESSIAEKELLEDQKY